jgi:hypothetical protein
MVLRIKTSDFSSFAGSAHGYDKNVELDKYITAFRCNSYFSRFEIESEYNGLDISQIAYIQDRLPECKMRIKSKLDDDGCGKNGLFTLCFSKIVNEPEKILTPEAG